jgi:hypothetical protein
MSPTRNSICPVCGFTLDLEPWFEGSGSQEICPSCGIQFGYDDAAGGDAAKRQAVYLTWRARWKAGGMAWASAGQSPPLNWDPARQVKRVERDV